MIPAIRTEGVAAGYNGKAIVSDLNLSLPMGQIVAFIGRNGVGKSTVLRTLTGELPAVKGKVYIDGIPLADWGRSSLAAKMSIVTTDSIQAGALTVRELVALGRHPYTGVFGRMGQADHQAVDDAIKTVGIGPLAGRYVASLSDGERQKAMIARALSQDTPIIVLDEPFSFLDVAARVEILSILTSLAHNGDKAILFSSHDIAQALRMSDYIWMLTPDRRLITGAPGYLKESGLIESLFNNASVKFDISQNDFIANQ